MSIYIYNFLLLFIKKNIKDKEKTTFLEMKCQHVLTLF